MKTTPDYEKLRLVRDFLATLGNSDEDTVIDLLTNNGEDMVVLFQQALGAEAFVPGYPVRVENEDGEFEAVVTKVKGSGDSAVFIAEDDEGNIFECGCDQMFPRDQDS